MPRAGIKGNSGGKKGRSGRKTKAEEMGLAALLDSCWTSEDRRACIMKLASLARTGDMDAIRLLMQYTYGKPVDRKEITGVNGEPIRVITAQELSDDELAAIAISKTR